MKINRGMNGATDTWGLEVRGDDGKSTKVWLTAIVTNSAMVNNRWPVYIWQDQQKAPTLINVVDSTAVAAVQTALTMRKAELLRAVN